MHGEHARTIAPARALAAETLTLERTLSDLVNQAYVLTPAEIYPFPSESKPIRSRFWVCKPVGLESARGRKNSGRPSSLGCHYSACSLDPPRLVTDNVKSKKPRLGVRRLGFSWSGPHRGISCCGESAPKLTGFLNTNTDPALNKTVYRLEIEGGTNSLFLRGQTLSAFNPGSHSPGAGTHQDGAFTFSQPGGTLRIFKTRTAAVGRFSWTS